MIHHYQSTGERDAYVLRFGIDLRPPPQHLVWPGEMGTFVRRPRADHPGSNHEALTPFEAVTGRWGLIPLFSKDGLDPLFEARAESASGERNFYQPWKRGHRCVLLVDAVFEERSATGPLVRHARVDGKSLGIAGLWNGWRSPQGQCVESFAILSVSVDDGASRQPALLHDAWLEDWLSCPVEETAAFLRPYSSFDDELVTHEVARP